MDEIFSPLAAHLAKGLCYHKQFTIIYGFLNLEGYQRWQQHQFLEESKNYQELYNFYLRYYNKLLMEDEFEKPQIIPSSWYKYDKFEVDSSTKRSTIRDMMKLWKDWEEETTQLLMKDYQLLTERGDIYAALYIKKLLEETEEELNKVKNEYINLEAIGYDLSVIVPNQKNLYEEDD